MARKRKKGRNRMGNESPNRSSVADSTIGKSASTVDAVKTLCIHQFRQRVLGGNRAIPLTHPAIPAVRELGARPSDDFLTEDWPKMVNRYGVCMGVQMTTGQKDELAMSRAVVNEVGRQIKVQKDDCMSIVQAGDRFCETEGVSLAVNQDHPFVMLGSTINMAIRTELANRGLLHGGDIFAFFSGDQDQMRIINGINTIAAEVVKKLKINYQKRIKKKGWEYDPSNPLGWLN